MPQLNEMEAFVIDRARRECERLILLAVPSGSLAGMKCRGRLSARAKWLVNEIDRLKRELDGVPEPAAVDPDEAEIAARAKEIRDSKLLKSRATRANAT